MAWNFLGRYREAGLLLLRIGLGVMFIVHGLPMLLGGPAGWHKIGAMAMHPVGINFYPAFWGALAALSEVLGGILVVFGLWFRPACFFLALTLTMATIMHVKHRDDFNTVVSHAAEMAIVFYCLMLIGPGRFSVDKS
jgi:putative oxidoreductase